jgi:5-methylcytosine-specific restriction endonuclease McrA
MQGTHSLTSFSDDELLRRLSDLLAQSRRDEADLVAHIAEVDRRRLYAREASPSMFAYCTEVLHLSEAEAYLRIAAARASREYPVLLTMLADGRLHLTAIAKLAPHLTSENGEAVLQRAVHRSKREIEELVAEISPRPDAPPVIRKLPDRPHRTTASLRVGSDTGAPTLEPRPGGATTIGLQLRPDGVARQKSELRPDGVGALEPAPGGVATRENQACPDEVLAVSTEPPEPQGTASATSSQDRSARIEALAPHRYKVQFTASAEFHDKLVRLQALMGSSTSDGDLAALLEQAVTEKIQRLEARRFARTQMPRATIKNSQTSPTTRRIPAAVRRAVYERDGGRCRFEDRQGRRCTARQQLEFHHRHPYGHGGDHSPANISLMCRSHNAYLAEIDYGREAIARRRHSRARPSEPPPHPSP